ncbi:hypothetical protein QQF64_013518 [Cirrhinus molitorella]|uniref:Reverse transcriptase/retrotransposon-derived protein RNase H-like domain-containing protein n=1 Tax=Cirrhinus molitorella TaxID=172907 RepID=A0ABR3LRE4_9TELE
MVRFLSVCVIPPPPPPYRVSIGRYQRLGKLYEISDVDIYGRRDLALSTDGVVDINVVEATNLEEESVVGGVSPLSFGSGITDQQRQAFHTLLKKWSGVFARDENDLGCTEAVQHRIYTGDAPPIREQFRPLPPMRYKQMKLLLIGMLETGVITESSSPWAASIVMVKKKDGSWRFCVDYRKLNAVEFMMPRIEETLTTLTQDEWFTTLDLASGYWQAPILAYADFSLPFVLYTDASHQGLGAVLSQVQDGQEHNNPVAHLQTARLGAVEQRWVAQLASFDFSVKYRPGRENINADSLSRFPVDRVTPVESRQIDTGFGIEATQLSVEDILVGIYTQPTFTKVQIDLSSTRSSQTHNLKLLRYCSTRWFSLLTYIQTVLNQWDVVQIVMVNSTQQIS